MCCFIQYIVLYASFCAPYNENGNWMHEEIALEPQNPNYNPIIINEENAEDFRIVGEFVGIVKLND